jgi:hypothetical protein
MTKLAAVLEGAAETELALILDFTGVTDVNASFLKATVYWALQCGQLHVRTASPNSSAPWAPRPLKLFPAVTGCSDEVADEIGELFKGRSLPLMHLEKTKSGKRLHAHTLGVLDPLLDRTLSSLSDLGECTAADLAAKSNESISINGWSNRLADLHLLRLATRMRKGKFFVYKSAADAISPWD